MFIDATSISEPVDWATQHTFRHHFVLVSDNNNKDYTSLPHSRQAWRCGLSTFGEWKSGKSPDCDDLLILINFGVYFNWAHIHWDCNKAIRGCGTEEREDFLMDPS